MIELVIEQVEFLERGYKIRWNTNEPKNIFRMLPLDVSFEFKTPKGLFYPVNNLLAFTLPILAKEYGRVRIISDFDFSELIKRYWENVLKRLNIEDFHLDWKVKDRAKAISLRSKKESIVRGRTALLFGGGIESTFALSVLHPYKPLLIAILGESWMNNDLHKRSIKQRLEDELISDFDIDFQRVTSNAWSLINKNDLYKNYYVTGLMFYWHSLPVCRQFGVYTVYESMELEYALSFESHDLSLTPSFLRNIIFENEPLFLPLFTCYPKIQMLAGLAETPFIKYIYSCFHNTDKRWCGECSKCYRISEYCERLDIDKRLIGMQEGIVGLRENSPLARFYWELPDQLYGKRKAKEFSQAIKYYRQQGKHAFLRAVAHCVLGKRADRLIRRFKSF